MKTAVDWLVEQLYSYPIDDIILEKIEQAKEMEKEQMKALYTMCIAYTRIMELYDFDEYYNKTFKSE